mgnify:CR=1 FL=1
MTRDEIVTALRCCAEGKCHGCAIYNDKQRCQERVLDAAADLIEKLIDRCACYAEEIAVAQERTRWVQVEERLPAPTKEVE